jgi:hypothetical protein
MCCVCHRDFDINTGREVILTAKEKQVIASQGQEPPEKLLYCTPCWKTISDPIAGPALFRGIFEGGLRRLGVLDAEERANKYHAWLSKKASKPRS